MLALWTALEITVAIVVPLVELLGLYCAWRALMHTRTAQGAAAWIVSLVLQPFIALPMYAVFGRRRFVGYAQARRNGTDELSGIASRVKATLKSFGQENQEELPNLSAIEKLAELPFTGGNHTDLLINGPETFDSIISGIDAATGYVLVQFFIVRDDDLGQRLKRLLLARAKDGLLVLFLCSI